MKNYLKKISVIVLIIAVIAISPKIYAAVSGEVLLNVQDSNTTSYLKGTRVKDGGNLGDNVSSGIVPSALYVYDGATDFHRLRGSVLNGLEVDVTRLGTVTPVDNFANPADGINSLGLSMEYDGATWDRIRHSFSQSATGITTNAAGTSLSLTTTPTSNYTMLASRTAGATDVVEIDLECSIDNVIFAEIATITTLAVTPFIVNAVGYPCNYIRYNVVTVGAGNTLTIQMLATR